MAPSIVLVLCPGPREIFKAIGVCTHEVEVAEVVNKGERKISASFVSLYYDRIRRIEFRVPPAGYYPTTFSLG